MGNVVCKRITFKKHILLFIIPEKTVMVAVILRQR